MKYLLTVLVILMTLAGSVEARVPTYPFVGAECDPWMPLGPDRGIEVTRDGVPLDRTVWISTTEIREVTSESVIISGQSWPILRFETSDHVYTIMGAYYVYSASQFLTEICDDEKSTVMYYH